MPQSHSVLRIGKGFPKALIQGMAFPFLGQGRIMVPEVLLQSSLPSGCPCPRRLWLSTCTAAASYKILIPLCFSGRASEVPLESRGTGFWCWKRLSCVGLGCSGLCACHERVMSMLEEWVLQGRVQQCWAVRGNPALVPASPTVCPSFGAGLW